MGTPLNANKTQGLFLDLGAVISVATTGGSGVAGAGGAVPSGQTIYSAPITNYEWAKSASIMSSGSNAYDLVFRRIDIDGRVSDNITLAASGVAINTVRTNLVTGGILFGANFQIGCKNIAATSGNFLVSVALFG